MRADLTITAANVIAGSGAKKTTGTAGASVTAGQVVYLDSATNSYKLADNDAAGAKSPAGIALHASASGQPLTILSKGPVTIGATVTAGNPYYLSNTAGGICPFADLGTGETVTLIGLATSASVIDVNLQESGVTL